MASQPSYVLDTFALIAFFNREPGHEVVRVVLREYLSDQAIVLMSEVNWGELYYMTAKKAGLPQADLRLKHIDRLGIIIAPVTRPLVKAAAEFKIHYSTSKQPLSYADCFAGALAKESGATLLTGDPEFTALSNVIPIRWLRATP
jgi:predicted nucleic acid-binding protein